MAQFRAEVKDGLDEKGTMLQPFGLSLGIDNDQFIPWREALFSKYEMILLVEGDADKEYLELLRHDDHGAKKLNFRGEIIAYGGRDTLKQRFLLNFLRRKCKKCFVTFDLDSVEELEYVFKDLGLESGKDYCPVGVDESGRRTIEGLLPDRIRSSVFGANHELVQQTMFGTKSEQVSAKNRLKRLMLDEFKKTAKAGDDDYREFYSLAKVLNKAFGNDTAR